MASPRWEYDFDGIPSELGIVRLEHTMPEECLQPMISGYQHFLPPSSSIHPAFPAYPTPFDPSSPGLTHSSTPRADSAHGSVSPSLNTLGASDYSNLFLPNNTFAVGDIEASVPWDATYTALDKNFVPPPLAQLGIPTDNGDTSGNLDVAATLPTVTTFFPKKRFYCPYCLETGKHKDGMATKHDWKRHIVNFHMSKSEWRCLCSETFERERDFKKHFKKYHPRQAKPRNGECKVPSKCVFACGFTDCIKITHTFKDWCNHVAGEMVEVPTKTWDFTWRMRNLLRHPRVASMWKRVLAKWGPKFVINEMQLHWDPNSTRIIRQQLECHNLGGSAFEDTLVTLFRLGLPNYNLSSGYLTQSTPATVSLATTSRYEPMDSALNQDPLVLSAFTGTQLRASSSRGYSNFVAGTVGNSSTMENNSNDQIAHANDGQSLLRSAQPNMKCVFSHDALLPDSTNTTPPLPMAHTALESAVTPSALRLRKIRNGTTRRLN
ncbi:hypothetical protein BDV96DRAFT_607923 [Lophiotrema nucula]|uniref:C2H2-type domain-containing protein n=1 Tax=Lophiotrema nucula TaxID=690887 RepID=A0A6A5YGH8_9PLEO|nr:hypothetical protein BDV96DRAFT_607923 [Lophiotrema nucula]